MMSSVAKVMLLSSDCDTGIRLSVESVQGIWLDTRHKFNVNLVFAYKRMKSVKNVFPHEVDKPAVFGKGQQTDVISSSANRRQYNQTGAYCRNRIIFIPEVKRAFIN